MTVETYSEMNDRIVEILRISSDNPALLYAAQRIEELEAEVERLQRELHDEQVRRNKWERMCEELGLVELEPAPDAPPCGHPRDDAIAERIGMTIQRRNDASPGINMIMFCGHPRKAATGDVTHWCTMCEEESQE